MKRRLSALLWFLLLATIAAPAADQSVGRIASLSGKVLIDQFGKGAFIAAVRGDLLYPATVLKTPANGSAGVEVQGHPQAIPGGATVRVSDLLAAASKKSGLPWFSALGNLVRSFADAAKGTDDTPTLGTKATEQAGPATEWQLDEADASTLLPQALELIRAGTYGEALGTLAKADEGVGPAQAWDLSFWRGFCYFQLEDYADAVKHHLAAQALGDVGTAQNRRMLLFQLGTSYYLLGQEKAAIGPLESLAAVRNGEPYEPYAALTLARALAATGSTARARAVAEEGRKTWQGTALEREFAALAP